ncbi:hypothetical protein ElyMa_006059300 [Elysia marginata]|uniref:Uncharacterized protein n=1 Tax=Elysia marginata TaxID=1093978 RepID=A0AAV4GP41_9GAST|nr:hypothetical protein ElyMa_006059300 [Elysia marginata]
MYLDAVTNHSDPPIKAIYNNVRTIIYRTISLISHASNTMLSHGGDWCSDCLHSATASLVGYRVRLLTDDTSVAGQTSRQWSDTMDVFGMTMDKPRRHVC